MSASVVPWGAVSRSSLERGPASLGSVGGAATEEIRELEMLDTTVDHRPPAGSRARTPRPGGYRPLPAVPPQPPRTPDLTRSGTLVYEAGSRDSRLCVVVARRSAELVTLRHVGIGYLDDFLAAVEDLVPFADGVKVRVGVDFGDSQ